MSNERQEFWKWQVVLMSDNNFPRVQEVIVPLLRDKLPESVTVSTWVNDIDDRKYPIVNVRRVGGYRSRHTPNWLDKPVVEIAVYSADGLIEAEELYTQVLDILFEATKKQTVTSGGHLSYMKETMGMTQFSSLFSNTWRIQGLIQVGVRAPIRKRDLHGTY